MSFGIVTMRVQIIGESDSAKSLAALLTKGGQVVVTSSPNLTISVVVNGTSGVVIDGIDCEFERLITNHIAELTSTRIYLHRTGGVRKDNAIAVELPEGDAETQRAAEIGILRAVLQMDGTNPKKRGRTWTNWFKRE